MENASKALIMAAGMLIAIVIVSLLIFSWKQFSEYQSSKDELVEIENTKKFNEQFFNYDRKDIQGYELLSLINKVIDYNERISSDTVYGNSDLYKPIDFTIKLDSAINDDKNRKKLIKDETIRLFNSHIYTATELLTASGGRRPTFKINIETNCKNSLENLGVTEEQASKIAKSIDSIFMDSTAVTNRASSKFSGNEELVYEEMARNFISASGLSSIGNEEITSDFAEKNFVIDKEPKYYNAACTYYEYLQFKKGIFECKEISLDTNTTRVTKMEFDFTGKIK